MPQGRRGVVCAQGVNIWTACKVLEESDKASGGTRLLTTGQLEGQQARGRHTQECTLPGPSSTGDGENKERLQTVCKVLPLGTGLQGVCLHTHRFLSALAERHLIQKLILGRLGAQNLTHARILLWGRFKWLQNVARPLTPDIKRKLFGGKKWITHKAVRTDYLIFSAFVCYFVPSTKFLKLLISLKHYKNLQASSTANN